MTHSPTVRLSESPISMGVRPLASLAFNTATSEEIIAPGVVGVAGDGHLIGAAAVDHVVVGDEVAVLGHHDARAGTRPWS